MRLLKTKQYQLVEAKDFPQPPPQYAILSHTWISPKDEITYQDVKTRLGDIENDIFKQKGWAKLKRFCDRAAKDGWEWAWMDTCCIDKTSPADTQEAINAMFRWYQNAGICYVYLEDVDVHKILGDEDPFDADADDPRHSDLDEVAGKDNVANPDSFLHKALNPRFINSKWFTRGWTLQELVAPHYLVFVDRTWRRIGTRESWAAEINKASRIEPRHLTAFSPTDLNSCSIAMRLSWASRRETTLEEDETYSLLGLFGISLPLIYGEGRWRAFNRLQRELITQYNDDSILAWKAEQTSGKRSSRSQWEGHRFGCGILTPSIREFWDASNIMAFGLYGGTFSMTNRGLEISAKRWRCKNNPSLYHIRLNCGKINKVNKYIVVYLSHVGDSYERIRIDELCDTETVKYDDDWVELAKEPILIRVSNHAGSPTCSSIFVLECPEQISIGRKYFVDFGASSFSTPMRLLVDGFPIHGLKETELFVEPNRLVFVNFELQHRQTKLEFDIIINLTEKGFPSVGVLERGKAPWERLGDPLHESLRTYEALAEHLHYSVSSEPAYPVIAVEEAENLVVGVHLLPRPRRLLQEPPGNASLLMLREYVLTVSVDTNNGSNVGQYSRKRRRN